ncbi:MAG TPA: glycosyltransferase [Catenuloplanes sp.]|jgi:glycosyltransferase involved in cell wall biosynthesis
MAPHGGSAGPTPTGPTRSGPAGISIVVPTLGRPSLATLLRALAQADPVGVPVEVLLVDDRPDHRAELAVPPGLPVKVLTGGAAGPAAARNTGWRAARHEWVAFLDDDVVPDPDWLRRLTADLTVPRHVGGSQGRVRVPLPAGRRPTDWERSTAGLADAQWITADMAYRRAALADAGGFDERFPRAYREDAELAYRVRRAGWRLVRGARAITHPVRPEGPWISVRTQRGNADDALLRRLYGPGWRTVLDIPPGRRPWHVATTATGAAAVFCAATSTRRRDRPARRAAAVVAGAGWVILTTRFIAARVKPGPRTTRELTTMAVTSVLIPPVASVHWLRGWWRARGARPLAGPR